ncbi:MAG: phosphate propanoyltransferase [Emergencia sp.]|nr:phosphate propanoyltransferase [Emergencia sp.]
MDTANLEERELKKMVKKIVRDVVGESEQLTIPVEMSARHVHLSQEDVEALFGHDAELTFKRALSLPGFLAEERVTVVTVKGSFKNVAVLGPVRSHTQVELSAADAFSLGINPPVNISGDFAGAEDVYLIGPCGMICARNSAIIARAHIHMNPQEASSLGLSDRQMVKVELAGKRPVTMHNIMIRVGEGMHAMMHIDMDEANASGYETVKQAVIRK